VALIGVLMSIWVLSGVLAYFTTEAVVLHCYRQVWDRSTREWTLVCSALLGPVYLLIALELLLFGVMGEGLSRDNVRHYKDS